jgi:hypothetical protein
MLHARVRSTVPVDGVALTAGEDAVIPVTQQAVPGHDVSDNPEQGDHEERGRNPRDPDSTQATSHA